ncbi:DUF2989 domain-containing protein [Shewanella waksmanii]|uniref:DUF2989 domain-containing protein n=1 Tax=Shewanella waksmanii TaxID=213783 RepID=UPI0004912CB9|nr:DUF2989 domain-containing protein [Shewanella waksmanii]
MKTNFVIITSFISLFAFSSLIGCDYGANTTTICKNNPEICADLHRDSWCRFEKGDLIRKRYLLKQTESPTGKQIYKHLLNLEKYNQCIELASGVQHILHPERTNDRMRAFGLSSQSLAELQATTKPSKDLYLSFYHWTRFSDQQAQQRVLNAEAAGEITETFILAQLASYYQKSDLEKAKLLYLSVLDNASEEEFDPDWLLGLSSIYYQQGHFELTYILSKANTLMSDSKASDQDMLALINGDVQLQSFLDSQADELVDLIESGDFKQSQLRLKFVN